MTTTGNGTIDDAEFERVQQRYAQERAKRIRTDGNDQYVEVSGEFSHFTADPYADPTFTREPLVEDVEFLLIGGGFGSLLAAAQLRSIGVEDIRVIDPAADFGGTWYWNRYPGVQCDIESYIYLPMLEDLGYVPKTRYSAGSEILGHAQNLGKQLDLYNGAIFQTSVTDMRWDEVTQRWMIRTDRGDELHARFVSMATGPLNRPKLPGIPGITNYRGHMFHTSRWDFSYTGGDESGNLTGLRGKHVAVVGTGSTGIQCIPHVAEWADQLYVVQRTPAACDVRANRPTDDEWAAELQAGWQRDRMINFTSIIDGGGADEDLVDDGWTVTYRELTVMTDAEEANESGRTLDRKERSRLMGLADLRTMERIRQRIEETVDDPDTAESLKPWYGRWCKRPQFHDEYYPTFNRPNVTLVDTDGEGVDRLTDTGFVVGEQEFEVDCIIFATGFEVGTDYTRRAQYDVIGRNGQRLSDKWSHGMITLHGMFTADFPNCFFLGQTQTGLTANYCHTVGEQAKHLAYVVDQARASGHTVIEATHEGETAYREHFRQVAIGNSSYYQACTPGFFTSEGNIDPDKGFFASFYGKGPLSFFELLEKWRESGDLAGIALGGNRF